jgi:oxygen-independent coproporphyrinogen-3 oxidase
MEALKSSLKAPEKFGVYLHWPFCQSKCPYCDFNSHVASTIDYKRWSQAYSSELAHFAELTGERVVSSIYFGGGTPSLMPPELVQEILDNVYELWPVEQNVEITLEANPVSVETSKFKSFADAGINRVSIGVQSLDDKALEFLGRKHSAAEAQQAIDVAAEHFSRFSFDLIYARPGQDLCAWEKELKKALCLADGHISLYQLTIEKSTAFYSMHRRGEFKMPDNDHAGELYELTRNILAEKNYNCYEISNYAYSGQESHHNLCYWRYEDYLGVGPGAHGRLTLSGKKYATQTHRAPEKWLELVDNKGHGLKLFDTVSHSDRFKEALIMGLRLSEGVSIDKIEQEANECLDKLICIKKLSDLEKEGLISCSGKRIAPTEEGMQRLDSIIQFLL